MPIYKVSQSNYLYKQKMSACFQGIKKLMLKAKKTKHFNARIQQRGILASTLELAQKYGWPKGDKLVLGKKQIQSALKSLDQERKELIKAMDQGGCVFVEADGHLITAYQLDSFRR